MSTPEEVIDQAIDEIRRQRHVQWERARLRCESPIEELYLAAVFAVGIDSPQPVHISLGKYRVGEDRFDGDHLWPQAEVGNYRLDFLFENISRHGRRRVAVECDGHDFHEKTKEQAARDKARDRFLASQGITVLRFTGSEIFRDPFACWGETVNVLWGLSAAA